MIIVDALPRAVEVCTFATKCLMFKVVIHRVLSSAVDELEQNASPSRRKMGARNAAFKCNIQMEIMNSCAGWRHAGLSRTQWLKVTACYRAS